MWVKNLRISAAKCGFDTQTDLMIRDRIVFGVKDTQLKSRLLRDSDLDLKKALDICRAAESTRAQIKEMAQGTSTQIDFVRRGASSRQQRSGKPSTKDFVTDRPQSFSSQRDPPKSAFVDCKNCGYTHALKRCPAYGKTCNKCGGTGHFAVSHGRRVPVNSVTERENLPYDCLDEATAATRYDEHRNEYDPDDLFLGTVQILNCNEARVVKNDWVAKIRTGDTDIDFKLDSGAQGNVLPLDVYRRIIPAVPLNPTNTILAGFGRGMKIKPVGVVPYTCTVKGKSQVLDFYVISEGDTALLGRTACESLGLIKLVQAVDSGLTWSKLKDVVYPENFVGDGDLRPEYDIKLDPSVQGTAQAPHRIPYAKLEPLRKCLEDVQARGIIADVDGPTPWVNNLVITEKRNGALRLCLDPKPLNKAILREHFSIPTPEEVATKLAGKKVFSVLDFKDAFWHVRLSEESSYYTTFHTPWGRKRFMRMPFGICSASEVLAKRIHDSFSDIENAHCIFDDMIVAGDDDEDHDEIMTKVMERARERNVKFNAPKTEKQYRVPQVKYVGNIISGEGLSADPEKIEAIDNMPKPEDKPALLRLLGMIKYLSKFIPDESNLTAPLRELLKEDTVWLWQPKHTHALDRIKEVLTQAPVLKFYDVKRPVVIQADASQSGLGACLMQDGQPVAYASRALTPAEKNYAQLEKELLSICFACHKFHTYIYGKTTGVQTDHKPLEIILKKEIAKASPRVQRMMMRLQRYQLNVSYRPGKEMYLADTLSRAYIPGEADAELNEDIEVMVHSVINNVPATPAKLSEIRVATANDDTLQGLQKVIMAGWPERIKSLPAEIREYWTIRDELTVADGLVFRGNRLVIPSELRSDMLGLLHEGHMGAEKSKVRARGVMYWPGISKEIDEQVAKCAACLQFRPANPQEPMIPHDIPSTPFTKVAMDIFEFQGAEYLIVVDYHSKYPEIARLGRGKSAAIVIQHVKGIFARHGIPKEIIADNMPFNSAQFRAFASSWGISDINTSSPRYAQSNGQAERMVGVVKQMLRKADAANTDPYIALLEYRTTPLTGMSYSPAQMAMGRQLRSKLPVSDQQLTPAVFHPSPHTQLKARQAAYKAQYDKSSRPLPPLSPGDTVRFKMSPNSDWRPAVVTAKMPQPRSYMIEHDGGELRRNRRHLMKTTEPPPLLVPPPEEPELPLTLPPPHPSPSNVEAVSPPRALPKSPTSPRRHSEHSSPQMPLQRPRRQCKPPTYLNDYVPK